MGMCCSCRAQVYMAPEVIKHVGYGKKAEVWALGILLHELLAGTPPFYPEPPEAEAGGSPGGVNRRGGSPLVALFDVIIQGALTSLAQPCFSSPAADVIKQLLRKSPAERMPVHQVRTAVYFEGFSWKALHEGKIEPPLVPEPHAAIAPTSSVEGLPPRQLRNAFQAAIAQV